MPKVKKRKHEAQVVKPDPPRLVPASNAGECPNCPVLRKKKGIPNSTRIYSKHGSVRYCICDVCKSTWKFSVLPQAHHVIYVASFSGNGASA